MKEIFTDIYARNAWHGGSGPGSDPNFCEPLVVFLREYLREKHINSLCDLGCGDLQWIPALVEKTQMRYIGVDCVESLLARHREKYRPPHYKFHCADVSTMPILEIPVADAYFIKDVMQHWPSENIYQFLGEFFCARPSAHFLTVNCDHQTSDTRTLDAQYHFAPLNGAFDPLRRFRPETLFAWGGKTLYRLRGPLPPQDSL